MEEEDLEASGDKRKQSWAGRLFSRAKRANKIHVLPDGVEGVFEPLQNQGIGHGPMVSCRILSSVSICHRESEASHSTFDRQ
jgi:hypothetical protein